MRAKKTKMTFKKGWGILQKIKSNFVSVATLALLGILLEWRANTF